MARAMVQIRNRETVGDDLEVTLHVTFYGNDMPRPDATLVKVISGSTDTFAMWRSKRNAAINAEAARIGITWNGRIDSDADLLRDA